jgi:ABC-type Na+ efflux pump permease subunit
VNGTALLMWGMLFGAIGFGFFLYGRKQKAVVPLIAGIALSVVPYFIANVYALVMVGVILVAIPYFVRI